MVNKICIVVYFVWICFKAGDTLSYININTNIVYTNYVVTFVRRIPSIAFIKWSIVNGHMYCIENIV